MKIELESNSRITIRGESFFGFDVWLMTTQSHTVNIRYHLSINAE